MTRLILIALLLFPLFAHPCCATDAQEKAPEVDLSKRVERLELQQELHKNAQEQRLDERLRTFETTVEKHHDSVVRESERLHIRADTQLSWLTWGTGLGLGLFTLLAAIGGFMTTWSVSSKLSQTKEEHENCIKLRERIEKIHEKVMEASSNTFKMALNIVENEEAISEKISPEDAKRSKDYMKTKEAQAALFSQAMIHTKAKKWDAALILWQDYIEYDPENAEALFYAALSASKLADHPEEEYRRDALLEQADKWYERSDALAPNLSSVLSNWGNLLSKRGKNSSGNEQQLFWDDAENKYRQATEADPQYANAWYNWGIFLSKRGENATGDEQQRLWNDAAEKYRRATEENPQLVEAWRNWGILLSKHGEKVSGYEQQLFWMQAEEKYRKVLSIDGNNPNVLFNLACLYGLRQDIDTCLEWLEKWFATNPVSAVEKLEKIQKDSDFDAVRDAPGFQTFLEQHREKPSSGED